MVISTKAIKSHLKCLHVCTLECFTNNFLFEPLDVKNNTEMPSTFYSDDLHSHATCSTAKSESVQCSYKWVDETSVVIVENAVLPVKMMNLSGNYTCIAKCGLSKLKECTIKAAEVVVIQRSQGFVHCLNVEMKFQLYIYIYIYIFNLISRVK